MKINDSDLLKLFSTFTDVMFDDLTHTYTHIEKGKLTSVTTVIHKYTTGFDEGKWLPIKSAEYNITEERLNYAWKWLNHHSTFKGSAIHNYIENYFLNKTYVYPKKEITKFFGYDPVFESYDTITKHHFKKFADIIKGRLIPIRNEMIVYDTDYMISGMVDQIFYNVKEGKFQVYDWKTNKQLNYLNKYQSLTGPLSHLEECEFIIYSLQLHLYKHIIEKNTGIKFCDDCYIVWFFEKNKSFELIKTQDMTFEVALLVEDFVKNNKATN